MTTATVHSIVILEENTMHIIYYPTTDTAETRSATQNLTKIQNDKEENINLTDIASEIIVEKINLQENTPNYSHSQ